MNYYSFVAASDADLMTLNDAQSRSDIQFTVALNSLSELSSLVSLLNAGLTLNLSVNIEGVKEIWSVSEPLSGFSGAECEPLYKKWLAISGRTASENENRWFKAFMTFIPEFNEASHSLILLEPKLAKPGASPFSQSCS